MQPVMSPDDPLILATLAAAVMAILSAVMDRRRGITRLSYLPWDYLFVGSALLTLLMGVRVLALWLRG
jgi:hypothetical protein